MPSIKDRIAMFDKGGGASSAAAGEGESSKKPGKVKGLKKNFTKAKTTTPDSRTSPTGAETKTGAETQRGGGAASSSTQSSASLTHKKATASSSTSPDHTPEKPTRTETTHEKEKNLSPSVKELRASVESPKKQTSGKSSSPQKKSWQQKAKNSPLSSANESAEDKTSTPEKESESNAEKTTETPTSAKGSDQDQDKDKDGGEPPSPGSPGLVIETPVARHRKTVSDVSKMSSKPSSTHPNAPNSDSPSKKAHSRSKSGIASRIQQLGNIPMGPGFHRAMMPPSKHKAESSDGSAATAADMSTVQADSGGEISHVNKSRPVMKRRGLRKTGSKAA